MRKKKLVKIVSASAMVASALVAAAPTEATTVAQADKLVETAKAAGNILKWAISIEGTADGKTRPWEAYNNAKTAYDNALKAVNSLSAKEKNKYLADLDQNVKLHINRTMAYIDAITAGEIIKEKQRALTSQLDLNLINDDTEKAYHDLSREIRKQAILLDRVYGQSTRDLIRAQYKQSAEKVRDSAIYSVTVKAEIELAQKAITANDFVKAEKHMDEVKKYLKYIDNAVIKNELTNRFNKIETIYTPKVQKVSAAEPKRITVDFNKVMLAGYGTNGAENTSNYAVSGRTISSAKLSEDKKSVIIELYESLYTNTTYTVTVKKNIQTANYETFSKNDYVTSFTFSDTTKPTVSYVTTNTNGHLEIKFSEIIASNSPLNITINGKAVTVNALYYDSDTAVINKTELDRLGLQKGKYYPIVVTGARDVVVNYPNSMNTYSGTFFYNSPIDTSLPEVRNIVAKGERGFTIDFSETLIDLTASHFVITKGNTTIRPSFVKDISGNKTKFEVELPTTVYGANENSVQLNVQIKDYKDLANNVGRTIDRYLSLSKDLAPPQFVSAHFDVNTNEIQVIFNKPLKAGRPLANKIEVYEGGKLVTPTPPLKANVDNKLVIDAKNLRDGNYIISVLDGAVQDNTSAQNSNFAFLTQSISKKSDIVKPTVSFSEITNGKIFAVFSEPVREDTAISLNNYFIDDKTLPVGTSVVLDNNNKNVTITLPEGTIPTTKNYKLSAKNVEDLSANIMTPFSVTLKLTDNKQPDLKSASSDHSGNLKLTFTEGVSLRSNAESNFVITVDNVKLLENQYSVRTGAAAAELLIVPLGSLSFTGKTVTIQTTNAGKIVDNAGNVLREGTKL